MVMNASLAVRGTLVLVVDALGPAFKGQPSYNILLAYTSMRLCLETDTSFESICLSQLHEIFLRPTIYEATD